MPELVEQMYCSQQIVIPPKFPYILKRYCKAAIKTQPYDILRWSFEYFKALAERRPPPVKLRLEYPVYSTEGGLTRGCLKVLANQLSGMTTLPIYIAKSAWQGFCLDPEEFRRILCLCEVHMRMEVVPFLHFIAVAGGMLTKSLTHTMILLCETLTKEPDGGSAAIPVHDFLTMYRFLARINASQDVRYLNGYKEGHLPVEEAVEEEHEPDNVQDNSEVEIVDDFWQDSISDLQKLELINDHVARSARLSMRMTQPVLGKIERSPSMERAGEIDRINYLKEIKEKPKESADVNKKLRQMSEALLGSLDMFPRDMDARPEENVRPEQPEVPEDVLPVSEIIIRAYDEDDKELPIRFYGQPKEKVKIKTRDENAEDDWGQFVEEEIDEPEEKIPEEQPEFKEKIKQYVKDSFQQREDRREMLYAEFDELNQIVDRFLSANYDLGMVAGRQMSTTSGEFIVAHIEKEIMAYINDQIAILPDPDLKKKKAKPEEVAMIRDLLETFLDENMDVIVKELEQVEEEEEAIPDIIIVYAVPGIGPPVDEETIAEFVDYAHEASKVQADVFMPRNIRHFMCPPLERYIEYNYDEASAQKEEVTTGGGVITD